MITGLCRTREPAGGCLPRRPARGIRHPPVDASRCGYSRAHRWLAALVQVHGPTRVPLPVLTTPLVTSRHRPDWMPLMVPSELNVHCWFVPPLQSHSTTFAPAVAPIGASRHLPKTCSVAPLIVQRWLAPPEESQMDGWVFFAVALFGSSRHRLEAALTSIGSSPGDVPKDCESARVRTLGTSG